MARKFLFPSRKGYLALETPEAAANAYLGRMLKAFEFCLPTGARAVPAGPDWLHEIKYDGYRLRLEREGDRVRSNPQIS